MKKLEEDYQMFDWWKKVFLNQYINFSGRARRKEYWYFTLVNILAMLPLYLILMATIAIESTVLMYIFATIFFIFGIALIIPSIAVTVRRLHDTNKSGWCYFLSLIPLLSIVLLAFMVVEGDRSTNRYGKDPKNLYNEEEINLIGTE